MKIFAFSVFLLASLLSLPVQAQEPAPAIPAPPAPPEAPAAPEAALAPQIVCDAPIHEFGEKNNTEFVEHDFPIRNAGTLSLEIRNVRASCGCTAVKPSQNVVPPGGEASVRARLDLRGRSGLQIKIITVESNDPQTPNLNLQLKGTAIQALRAQPSSMFFGPIGPDGVRSRAFDIISGRGPIQIVGIRADHPGLLLAPVAAEPGADGTTHRFELTLDPSLPPGPVNGSIFVKTDLEGQPEISIPVAAHIKAPEPLPPPETAPLPEPAPPPAP